MCLILSSWLLNCREIESDQCIMTVFIDSDKHLVCAINLVVIGL